MDFRVIEKVSIAKALLMVMKSDGKIDEQEVIYLNQIMQTLGFDMDLFMESQDLSFSNMIRVLSAMDAQKKNALQLILTEIIKSDGIVVDEELEMVASILFTIGVSPSKIKSETTKIQYKEDFLTYNNTINDFAVPDIYNDIKDGFNDDEITLIQDISCKDFNGQDISLTNPLADNNSIPLDIIIHMTDIVLEQKFKDPIFKIIIQENGLTKDKYKTGLTYILAKFLLNDNLDLNYSNDRNQTILSHLIGLDEVGIIYFLFKHRLQDLNFDKYESKFGDTYLDLIRGLGRDQIEEIFSNELRSKSEEHLSYGREIADMIQHEDIEGLIEKIYDDSLIGGNEGIASGYYNIGNYAGQYLNNNKIAIRLYQESIKYNDSDATVYNNMATSYKNLNEFEKALEQYYLSLKYDEENPIRYFRIALLYAYQGKNNDALMYAKKYFSKGGIDIEFIELCKNTTLGGGELLKLYNSI